jgi:two-component system, NarL family, response regulator NreC
MTDLRILIADDHALVRSGLRALLQAQPGFAVVGEAEDGVVVLERCRKLHPDVVVMDVAMPGRGGIGATEDLARECPGIKVVVLSMHDDQAYIRVARLAGAAGYVAKKALATELIAAIRAVHAGKTHFPDSEPSPTAPGQQAPALELITEREQEVMTLIALGHTTAETADKLHISEKTVESHRAHITEKLGLRTRAELVRFALEHGLVKP